MSDPVALPLPSARVRKPSREAIRYAELAVTSCFSFLRGASFPEELVEAAAILKLDAVAIADRNTLAGIVRAHAKAKELNIRLVIGARLAFADGTPDILAYPQDRAAYGRLCRLLTHGNTNEHVRKGECHLTFDDLLAHADGLLLVIVPPARPKVNALRSTIERLAAAAPGRLWIALSMTYGAVDQRRFEVLKRIAAECGVPLLATNDVLYHTPARRALQDVMTCIRQRTTLARAGRTLEANAERHLKQATEMTRLFRHVPEAVAETLRLMERARFSLDEIRYEYPDDDIPEGMTAQDELERRTWTEAATRYPPGIPAKVRETIEREFQLIVRLDYAKYFLTVHNIVKAAREKGILCQGRGSAANSTVCYCLGITEVDPEESDLLFERFISQERNEPPDIDVDFEHERRPEIIDWIYERYGRQRAAIAATVITFRGRMAIREVGKVFGLSEDSISALRSGIWGWSNQASSHRDAKRVGLDPDDPTLAKVLELAQEIVGFPRHLSQHVGGFVITRGRLDEIVPIGKGAIDGRLIVEWDKDDLDAMGLLKVDVLALGMLTCLRKSFDLLERHYGVKLTIAAIPEDDADVYDMICRADTIGSFQIESRAQQSMAPRLKPRKRYDLVIQIAIVRPGPIQGKMVHPFLRRRMGLESVSYPKQELEAVLHKTLGVPLFQEQIMRVAIVAAGFSAAKSDQLRRAMATFRRLGIIHQLKEDFISGMLRNGYEPAFAQQCWAQVEGFGSYGFPEAHSSAFAELAYASSWLKCHYPDVFATALLNSQPMGFYVPAQIVRDAMEHGVEVRPIDVLSSDWDCTLEDSDFRQPVHRRHEEWAKASWARFSMRLGMRLVKGLPEAEAKKIVEARQRGFGSIEELWRISGVAASALELLAEADAFGSLGLSSREALWEIRKLSGRSQDASGKPQAQPAFPLASLEPKVELPQRTLGEAVIDDYRRTGLSLKIHPAALLRPDLAAMGAVEADSLRALPSGRRVKVAGHLLVRQMPGSANGTVFLTIEDETGTANVIVWPSVFERFRAVIIGGRLIGVPGLLQNEHGVIHIVADRVEDLSHVLVTLGERTDVVTSLARADEFKKPQSLRAKVERRAVGSKSLAAYRTQMQGSLFPERPDAFIPQGRSFQ